MKSIETQNPLDTCPKGGKSCRHDKLMVQKNKKRKHFCPGESHYYFCCCPVPCLADWLDCGEEFRGNAIIGNRELTKKAPPYDFFENE